MFNNWFIEEQVLRARHNEMMKASEQLRLVKMSPGTKSIPLHAKTLSILGDNLIKAGFWLQGRYGSVIDFNNLEVDEPCWE